MIDNENQASNSASDAELIRRIWMLSWPTLIWSALEASLGLADLLMVRFLGPEATAAVGVSRQVSFLIDSVIVALASGVIAVVSQAVGGKRWDTVNQVLRQIGSLLVMIGLPVGILGAIVSPALLTALNVAPRTMDHAVPYLQISFLGIVFSWIGVVCAAFYRSLGNAVTPLKLAIIVACLNVPLNFLLIHGLGAIPALGVKGAALGTVAAKACGAIAYFVLLRRRATRASTELPANRSGIDWPLVRCILRIGTPMALAGLVRNGARLVFLAILGAGTMGMALHAAVGVGLQVRLLSVLPALAFQVATATLVGQAVGKGDYEEARRLGWRSVQLLSLLMFVVVAAIILCANALAELFVEDVTVVTTVATVLRWFAVAQFFSALSITVQGALMGAGDTLPNLRYTLFTQWIIMLPLTYVATSFMPWPLYGPLVAWTLAPALLLVLVARRFISGRWKTVTLAQVDP